MKYRYERIDENTGHVIDRITVDSAKELIKCIRNFEKFLKMNYKQEELICECGHKQWGEHKCTLEPMVAQECNVTGCKCKKFRQKRKAGVRKR